MRGTVLRPLAVLFLTAFRAAPRLMTLKTCFDTILYGNAVISALSLGYVVDAALRGAVRDAVVGGLLFGGVNAAAAGINKASLVVQFSLDDHYGAYMDERLARIVGGLPGLEHLESPHYLDGFTIVRQKRHLLTQSPKNVTGIIAIVVTAVPTLAVLSGVHPALLLLPLFGVGSLLTSTYAAARQYRVDAELGEPQRLANQLFRLLTTAESGKELRVFGLQRELMSRLRDVHRQLWRASFRHGGTVALLQAVSSLIYGAGYGAAIGLVLFLALTGRSSPGDVALVAVLALQVNGHVAEAAGSLRVVLDGLQVVRRYLALEEYGQRNAQGRTSSDADVRREVPETLHSGITFDHVSFRYPETEADVLRDVTLHLPCGSVVAIVGENGAGKTTLVKLLCRFYEPTGGRITVDGVDLGCLEVAAWRARTSAGFQDFARFFLLAREAVGVGDLARVSDVPAVEAALERAHAADVLPALPKGLETQLGRQFEGGVELSGGQWQKLALARALMRWGPSGYPLLLLLDEPTAALDAPTEHALFERYADAAGRAAAAAGAITVLVSHRFATVRMADLIVVLAGGRILEQGSHAELMQRGGLYAELYRLQSRAYR